MGKLAEAGSRAVEMGRRSKAECGAKNESRELCVNEGLWGLGLQDCNCRSEMTT